MSVSHNVAQILQDHVTFELECIDRMYLNVYVPTGDSSHTLLVTNPLPDVEVGEWRKLRIAIDRIQPGTALVWVYLIAYLVAFGLLYPAVARIVHDLHGWRPWALGWATFALYQVVRYVFVR